MSAANEADPSCQSAVSEAVNRGAYLVEGFGYCLGFLIVVLKMLRVWGIVLAADLAGTVIIGGILARSAVLPGEMAPAIDALAQPTMAGSFAGFASWPIGLMIWLLPKAGPSRPIIIILLTYAVAICHFPHIIAGSVETSYAMFAGHLSIGDYLYDFVAPTLIGNSIGGGVLAALLNHAPIAEELDERVRG